MKILLLLYMVVYCMSSCLSNHGFYLELIYTYHLKNQKPNDIYIIFPVPLTFHTQRHYLSTHPFYSILSMEPATIGSDNNTINGSQAIYDKGYGCNCL